MLFVESTTAKLEKGSVHPVCGMQFDYNKSLSILYYIERHVKENFDWVVLSDETSKLTYGQLYERYTQLAYYLTNGQHKVLKGDCVGICFRPCIDMVVAILGVLKAGGCYVPIESSYPKDRIDYIILDSNPKCILTNIDFEPPLESKANVLDFRHLSLEIFNNTNEFNISAAEFDPINGDDPAYIIYTSGSTGQPKGVSIPHLAVNNHMLWMQNEFKITEYDHFLLKTPLTFDPSVWEMFLPLVAGAHLVVSPTGTHTNPKKLIQLVHKYKITILQLVPMILHELLQQKNIKTLNTLRLMFVGGETLPYEVKELFFKKLNCRLVNLYGPAEATIDSTFFEINPKSSNLRENCIGRPIYNCQILLISDENNLCKVGEKGEIHISGDNLAIGYLNDSELTKNKFVDNPFFPGKKMYRTGDIAIRLENGGFEYVGRKDDQVKLNGVRIETNSLKVHILKNDNVENCFFEKKYNNRHYGILICYLMLKKEAKFSITEVKDNLRKQFPEFMLPKHYFLLNAIKLTVNGKVDLDALYENSVTFENELLYEPEREDRVEKKLAKLWKKVLGLDQIGENDNFYNLGGDSFTAFFLLEEIENEFKIELDFEDLLVSSTFKKQVNYIKTSIKFSELGKKITREDGSFIVCLQNHGTKTPLFLVHPIGGTIFWYGHLAYLMKKDRPVYGIQDPSLHGNKLIFESIEEMAQFYYDLIKKQQPSGPYLIGGASFGGTVAIEIARIMKKNNDEMLSVLIFDGWAVYPGQLHNKTYFKNSMIKQQDHWRTKFNFKHAKRNIEEMFEIQWHRLNLLYNYKMRHIGFSVVLFKAREIMPIFEPINSPCNHWDKYAKFLEKIVVSGNHETMFQKPHVHELAYQIDSVFHSMD